MSRAKVTFRDGKKLRRKPQPLAWWGVAVHSSDWQLKRDEELPPRLAEIIQAARDNYAQRRIISGDVRATLRALAQVEDEQATRAVRLMDDYTEAELATASMRLWKRQNTDTDAVPDDLFDFQGWTPDRVRLTAKEALRGMDMVLRKSADGSESWHPRSGRALKKSRDFALGLALARWWWNDTGERPTVYRHSGKEGDFLFWATEKFNRAGRAISSNSLETILQKVIRVLPRKP